MNVADYMIAGILIISGVHGWYIGFILSFFNIAGYFIAAFITHLYYKTAAVWIASYTQIDERIYNFINDQLKERMEQMDPETLGLTDAMSTIPVAIQEQFLKNWPSLIQRFFTSGVENLVDKVAEMIMNIMGMAVVFIVALILIKIVVAVLNTLAKAPGLKEINRGGGLILGLLKGLLVIFIILAMLTPLIGTNPDHLLSKILLDSRMGSWLYNHNVLMWWLKDYLLTEAMGQYAIRTTSLQCCTANAIGMLFI